MKVQSKNYQQNLNQHQLATQPLRELLRTAGQPTTPEEKRIMASVARAYERMGDTFPTKELSKELDALYSQAVSLHDRVGGALTALIVEHPHLAIGAKGLSYAHITPKTWEATNVAWSKAFRAINLDLTHAEMRCREVPYLVLASASKLINAALKAAKKER